MTVKKWDARAVLNNLHSFLSTYKTIHNKHWISKRDELTANEARVFQNLFFLLFLAPQIGECIDDDAKYQIENNNNDNEEEEEVIDDTSEEQRLLTIYHTDVQWSHFTCE